MVPAAATLAQIGARDGFADEIPRRPLPLGGSRRALPPRRATGGSSIFQSAAATAASDVADPVLPLQVALESLRSEEQAAAAEARLLWTTVGEQDQRLRHLEALSAEQAEIELQTKSECRSELDELRQIQEECGLVEVAFEHSDMQRSHLEAEIEARQTSLNKCAQEIGAAEDAFHDAGDHTAQVAVTSCLERCLLGDDRRSAARLQKRICRLQGQAGTLAEKQTRALRRLTALQSEAQKLEEDHRNAVDRAFKQAAERNELLDRLGRLWLLKRPPHRPNLSLAALAEHIAKDWRDATNSLQEREATWSGLEKRLARMQHDLRLSEDSEKSIAAEVKLAEGSFVVKHGEWRARQREAAQELTAARVEHTILRQAQTEWKKQRPQMVDLVEDLRAGSRRGTSMHEALSDRLATLRSALGQRSIS